MPNRPERPWTEAYYAVVEHFFRAPDTLEYAAATPPKGRGLWAIMQSLQRRVQPVRAQEVPFERLLNLFVAMAPPSLVSDIIERATGWPCMGPFRLLGENLWRRLERPESERPAVVFSSSQDVFIIELKAHGKKAGLEQIVTDALLVQRIRALLTPSRCGVVYLTRAAPGEAVPPIDREDVRRSAIRRLPHMQDRTGELDVNGRVMLADTISAFELATLSYTDLDYVLGGYAASAAPARGEGMLIEGLRRELRLRRLTGARYLESDMSRLAS